MAAAKPKKKSSKRRSGARRPLRIEQRLLIEHTVTRILAESGSLEEAAPKIIRAACEVLKWACGSCWRHDPASGTMRCVGAWGIASARIERFLAIVSAMQQAMNPGGLFGQAWAKGEPKWMRDVTREKNFRRAPDALEAGLRSAFAFPIKAGAEVIGAMEFFSREIYEPDKELLDCTTYVGSQIGQFCQRTQAQSLLRESEERSRTTFELAAVGICHIDMRGRFIHANRSLCQMLGYSEEELLGRTVREVSHPDDRNLTEAKREQLYAGRIASVHAQKRYLHKDGTVIWADIKLALRRAPSGEPLYVISVIEDISARKRGEEALAAAAQRVEEARRQAEAANVAKTKFLAAASHDLRQPMQALSMYTSVLEERVTGAAALRIVRGIELSVATLEQLFDSLLDISKIELGVMKPNVSAFALMPLIERVVEAEMPLAAQKSLDLRAVRTSASVKSDPAMLERMLKNLLTNAIRYTQRGRIVVGCRRGGADRLRLEVVDSGIGIALEEQERIFDEYYQLSGKSAQGLGLGLPIVKSLGELLGHKIGVRSAVGRGSVFSIELERSAAVAPVAADAGHAAPAALSGMRVVLVDDDVEIRDSVRLVLERWGCRIVSGATLAEVASELEAQRLVPDALIVDYRLADAMDGLQVIERLRNVFGEDLPALIVTGTTNFPLLRPPAAGISIAMKPVPAGKLRAFLSQILR